MKSKRLFATLIGIVSNELVYDFMPKGIFLTFMIRYIVLLEKCPLLFINILKNWFLFVSDIGNSLYVMSELFWDNCALGS